MTAGLDWWLAPLRRFADLHTRTLRTCPLRPVLDLSYPNPNRSRDPRGVRALRQTAASIDEAALQYTPFGGRTVPRRRIAAALTSRSGLAFTYQDVLLTPGGTAALCASLCALFEPGDEVVLMTPCWMDYPLYLARFGLVPRMVPGDPAKRLDVAAVEAAWTSRTAGLVISQPNCPTGVVADQGELARLAAALDRLARRSGRVPVLISDEVHRDQVWDRRSAADTCPSPLAHHPATLCLYSFGKAWAMQGQRTGYVAVSPAHPDRALVRQRLTESLRVNGFCAPTALMQAVAGELAGLAADCATLAEDQRRVRGLLTDAGIDPVPAQGSSFVYCACPKGVDDWTLVESLAAHGVLAMPSSVFYEADHVRFALNIPPDQFPVLSDRVRTAVARIGRARIVR